MASGEGMDGEALKPKLAEVSKLVFVLTQALFAPSPSSKSASEE